MYHLNQYRRHASLFGSKRLSLGWPRTAGLILHEKLPSPLAGIQTRASLPSSRSSPLPTCRDERGTWVHVCTWVHVYGCRAVSPPR